MIGVVIIIVIGIVAVVSYIVSNISDNGHLHIQSRTSTLHKFLIKRVKTQVNICTVLI